MDFRKKNSSPKGWSSIGTTGQGSGGVTIPRGNIKDAQKGHLGDMVCDGLGNAGVTVELHH